ncbi:MAG: phosphatidate cytidylyltransferase, partial [Flavobacteriia bacterium]|nr:phosphatidate cytidylyltransferase [Flavobacteriia bacterium]
LILAICDPIAALTGKRWPLGKYSVGKETKTLMGSGMFLASALIVYISLTASLHPHTSVLMLIWRGLIVASIAALAEAVSGKGTDNITIPGAVLLALYLTNYA